MKIHVSDPCKMLLDDRYVLEERSEGQELMDKVIRMIMGTSQRFLFLMMLFLIFDTTYKFYGNYRSVDLKVGF